MAVRRLIIVIIQTSYGLIVVVWIISTLLERLRSLGASTFRLADRK